MTNTGLNAADLATYTADQVASLADLDPWAVRDEAYRRNTAACKALERAKKALAKAEREIAESVVILDAARREFAKL